MLRAVSHALDAGYRHIDSAVMYRNEAACGGAICDFIGDTKVPREGIFFTSKIYGVEPELDFKGVKRQSKGTLKVARLGYVGCILIHAPINTSSGRKGVWRALVETQEKGLTKSIGLSNYGIYHLLEMERHIKELEKERGEGNGGTRDVGQWEMHPWLPRSDIVEWCRKRGLILRL